MKHVLSFVLVFAITLSSLALLNQKSHRPIAQYPPPPPPPQQWQPPPPPPAPEKYTISAAPASYVPYEEIVAKLKQWNQEAPEITEFSTYGKTSKGKDCTYLRVGTKGMPKVLIHAEIHGNEILSTGATLWIIQKMLHDYGRDPEITWLVKNRDVWWVPVLSPDTHRTARWVDGVDPNRNYSYPGREKRAVAPIANIQKLHLQHHFKGVISGHTTGNIYFWPSIGPRSDKEIHRQIANKMGELSGYRASAISSSPAGYEIDWYYWKGAVAILTEMSSGGHNQPASNIPVHGNKNYPAYMAFIKDAPELAAKLNPPGINVVYPSPPPWHDPDAYEPH